MRTTIILARVTCLTVGAALAAVGMFASYDAAIQSGSKYLMIAAPLIALAAPLVMVFVEIAVEARQHVKALALLTVFGLCAATVFYTAAERNHAGRAVGEAQRIAYRAAVTRATAELADAKAAAKDATAKADKVRGLDAKACRKTCLNAKASETAAAERVAAAEKAMAVAEATAVTESDLKQPDWLLPASVDIANMVLIWVGFGLGRMPVPSKPEAPALTKRQIAARKGLETKKQNKRQREKAKQARKAGFKVAASR